MTSAGRSVRVAIAATSVGFVLAACASQPSAASAGAQGVSIASPPASPVVPPASLEPQTVAPIQRSNAPTVPWVDRPAPPYVDPSPSPLPTDARPCRVGDLRISVGDGAVAMSNVKLPVMFTNKSTTTCVLVGYPTLAGITPAGQLVGLPPQHGSYFGEPGPASNIAPGSNAVVFVGWYIPDVTKQPTPPYRQLRIGLPAGGYIDVAASGLLAIDGTWITGFGVPAVQPPPAPDPPASPLVASVNTPPTVRPGETLDYTVTLTNPTDSAYRLEPCPAYTEFVGSGTQTWVATVDNYYLNCDTVHEIATHSSVTYEMRLAVPSDQPLSSSPKFGWNLQGIDTAGMSTQIAVVG